MVFLQRIIPKRALTRLVGAIAVNQNVWFKNALIRIAMRYYRISLIEAKIQDIKEFDHFNAFFTRALKPTARPINNESNTIISPADGFISEQGDIQQGQLLQAKGRSYELSVFLGRDVGHFKNGSYSTIYLSPSDYHRVHMPIDGELLDARYIPGTLFAVNLATCRGIDNLFGRNERLVARFKTDIGEVFVVFVAALMVAGIETVWHQNKKSIKAHDQLFMPEKPLHFSKGDEIGRFCFGSTVVLIAPEGSLQWSNSSDTPIRMGEKLATVQI